MSGVADTVKKVFKRAVKETRRISPTLMAGAAIYFTMGAAFGGGGGGGGQAATAARNALGLEPGGILDNVLFNALEHTAFEIGRASCRERV